jgi:hypothetical protein
MVCPWFTHSSPVTGIAGSSGSPAGSGVSTGSTGPAGVGVTSFGWQAEMTNAINISNGSNKAILLSIIPPLGYWSVRKRAPPMISNRDWLAIPVILKPTNLYILVNPTMFLNKPATLFGFTLKQLPFEIGQIVIIMLAKYCSFFKVTYWQLLLNPLINFNIRYRRCSIREVPTYAKGFPPGDRFKCMLIYECSGYYWF